MFFISAEDYFTYFDAYSVSYQNDAYLHSTSTIEGDTGLWTQFNFNIGTAADGFIGVDFYTPRMYPSGCKLGSNGLKATT